MSIKSKSLRLGFLTLLAMGALGTMNAGAEVPGHFTFSVEHTIVKGTEEGTHYVHFKDVGSSAYMGCTHTHYEGTATGETVESIRIVPSYTGCYTTPTHGSGIEFTINGCDYTLRLTRDKDGMLTPHSSIEVACPSGNAIELHLGNCTITVIPQVIKSAVSYSTTVEQNKHAITLGVTTKAVTSYHGGICIFLGTSGHEIEMSGSIKLWGEDTLGNRVDITAT